MLDPEQPIFTDAMTDLTPGEAQDALACLRLRLNASEAHSTALFRRKGGIDRLARLFAHPEVQPARVAVFVIHKKHMVVTKMIDLLVENLAHRDGIDLYKDDANIALSNLATMMIESFLDAEHQMRLLNAFVQMLKLPSAGSVATFYAAVDQTMRDLPATKRRLFEGFMVPIAASRRIIFDVLEGNDKLSLDPIIPSMSSLTYHWGKQYPQGFTLKADASKTRALKREALELFMVEQLDGIEIGYDRRRHPDRVPIRQLTFCSSEDEPSIQVADIVAGVVMRYGAPFAGLTSGIVRSDELVQFNPVSFMVGNIWPMMDVTPDQFGTRHAGGTHPVYAYSDPLRRQ